MARQCWPHPELLDEVRYLHAWPLGRQRIAAQLFLERTSTGYHAEVRVFPAQRGPIHDRLLASIDAIATRYDRVLTSVPDAVRWRRTYKLAPEVRVTHYHIKPVQQWLQTILDRLPETPTASKASAIAALDETKHAMVAKKNQCRFSPGRHRRCTSRKRNLQPS
jgi:hypothetical protein